MDISANDLATHKYFMIKPGKYLPKIIDDLYDLYHSPSDILLLPYLLLPTVERMASVISDISFNFYYYSLQELIYDNINLNILIKNNE
jgi:hypothetical protein